MSDLIIGNEVFNAMLFLILDFFIYGVLAYYLNQVAPQEFGSTKPWHFPISDLVKAYKRRQRVKANGGVVRLFIYTLPRML